MTWGAGLHLCPGKSFALYEIKTFIALMTMKFNIPKITYTEPTNFFCPAAFAMRPAVMHVTALDEHQESQV